MARKEKKPVKPIVRVLGVAVWLLVAGLVAAVFFGGDEGTAKKIDYKVTQQRYDDAGMLYINAKADVKKEADTNALVKQIEKEHLAKQKGNVDSMFVHVFNAKGKDQGIYKIAYSNKGKAQTGLNQLNEWVKQ